MTDKTKSILKNVFGLLLSGAILLFVVRRLVTDWGKIAPQLSHINWWLFGVGVLAVAVGQFFTLLIWHRTAMDCYGLKLSMRRAYIMLFLPVLARYVPGKIWFIFGIAYLSKKWDIDMTASVVSSLLTQMFVLLGALVFGIAIMGISSLSITSIWIVIVAVVGISAFVLYPGIVNIGINLIMRVMKKRTAENVQVPRMRAKTIAINMFYAIAIWASIGIAITLQGIAISHEFTIGSYWLFAGAFALSYLIGGLSIITPAGLGVREGALMILLGKAFSESSKALFSFGARLVMTAVEIPLFLLCLVFLKLENISLKEAKTNDA